MDHLKARIKRLIAERLNLRISPEEISNASPIFDSADGGLGLDSIDALDLVVGIFEEFNVEVEQNDMHIFRSVNTLAEYIGFRTNMAPELAAVAVGHSA
jgi:acyl carrier protein